MTEDLYRFYLHSGEPNRSWLLALQRIILDQDKGVSETRKYGMPCFCYQGKAFCYLWIDKKTTEPYLLLVEGKRLHHPNLESGNRSRMKIFRVNPNTDLPIDDIQAVINAALDLYVNRR